MKHEINAAFEHTALEKHASILCQCMCVGDQIALRSLVHSHGVRLCGADRREHLNIL